MSDFIDRTKAEAERRFPDSVGGYPTNTIPEYQREAFLGGAEWAVEQEPTDTVNGLNVHDWATIARAKDEAVEVILNSEPTDREIEAAARALYDEDANEAVDVQWPEYDSPENVGRPLYEERARNALLAAREARKA